MRSVFSPHFHVNVKKIGSINQENGKCEAVMCLADSGGVLEALVTCSGRIAVVP
jgi:hypothetical protein